MIIKNIGTLAGVWDCTRVAGAAMTDVPTIENAFLTIEGGKIVDFGSMANCPDGGELFDALGALVFPSFCDSHTHLVYAAERNGEWEDRLRGVSYELIAARGGGILNSVDILRQTPENELFDAATERCHSIVKTGTGAVEIKSGYGLDLQSELKMLRVIARLKQSLPITIKSNFLAAHATPKEYIGRQGQYVDLICDKMLPAVAAEGLADFVDVFCDEGFFSVTETERILNAAAKYNIRGKIHANELAASGGVELACRTGCLSADHLERMNESAFAALVISQQGGGGVMPTALPGASFFLKIPYTPLREMISRGLAVAIASDYNPGSAPSGNMQLCGTLACLGASMQPNEVLTASTINGAAAMGVAATNGRIAKGAWANICIAKKGATISSLYYNFGENSIAHTIVQGRWLH